MSAATELTELHHLVEGMQRCVTSLRAHCGDTPAMRRIANDADRILNDVERLDIDAGELDASWHRGPPTFAGAAEKIAVPDTAYASDFWRDVDDEGVGGHNRHRG